MTLPQQSAAESLPVVPRLATIAARLPLIFPEGAENRTYVVREMAAKTIYVMFYAGAIHGMDRWIRPNQVVIMTDTQAAMLSAEARAGWIVRSLSPNRSKRSPGAWYADNSRESIRDETIRFGLAPTGAVVERPGLPTTSAKPKYALAQDFALLFDENIDSQELAARIQQWQAAHLSKSALARQHLIKQRATFHADAIRINFPNGESRLLSPGLSSHIAKAVIEEFAPRFLLTPAVLWLSEPGNKVIARDEALAQRLGIIIEAHKNLPDIILIDTGADGILIVFVEVVASDGPINQVRRNALLNVTLEAGYTESNIAFVTAFNDRAHPAYRKLVSDLAWSTFAWFASEPDSILLLASGEKKAIKLADLIGIL